MIKLPNAVTVRASRLVLKTQKHSPAILFAVGVTSGIATVVTACRSTLKVEDVLKNIEKDKLKAQEALGLNREDYTENIYKRDMVIIHVQGAAKLVQLYAPAIVLGTISVACLTGSHRILTNRNAGLTAAYTAVSKGFDEYRERVRADVGDDKEREYYYGAEKHDVTTTDKSGKTHTKKVTKSSREGGTPYARFYGSDNFNWSPIGGYNVSFLRGIQTFANQRLQAKGHLFLNDLYKDLGMDETSDGAIRGWLKEKGDYIDFGIWDEPSMHRFHEFVVHDEGIWLDFPGTSLIWDQI